MDLYKTTILPTDEKKLAKSMFADLVHERPHVLVVVFGKGANAEKTVQRADKLTGEQGGHRWVVWARRPGHISEELAQLPGGETAAAAPETIRAISISLDDKVKDNIGMDEPVPNFLRLFAAFVRAEVTS